MQGWLDSLPQTHRHLVSRLRDMLTVRLSNANAGFIEQGPKLLMNTFATAAAQAKGTRSGCAWLLSRRPSGFLSPIGGIAYMPPLFMPERHGRSHRPRADCIGTAAKI